jgi:hypothetical protein
MRHDSPGVVQIALGAGEVDFAADGSVSQLTGLQSKPLKRVSLSDADCH